MCTLQVTLHTFDVLYDAVIEVQHQSVRGIS